MKYAKELRTAVTAVIVLTVLLGVIYPLTVTAIGQVIFPHQANGSAVQGGSSLIAQKRAGLSYFKPRPSATDYSATATYFANRGPNSVAARAFYEQELAAYIRRESPYNPDLKIADVPVDAVTDSASGVDPHITVANARIQGKRVAAQRGISPEAVNELVEESTDGRFAGLFGERGVNTTKLNIALDKEAPR